jgi:phosphoribosylaminoimidazolecarboxamide formyltransferase/IMP cyclohydrolase
MTQDNNQGLRQIRRALISVSDKTGIVEFARELKTFGIEIISTGGTAKALREAGLDVVEVSDVTGFPEMMDGRVKTLHPKIHGALLGLRDHPEHVAAMREHAIEAIDMVVINLYPFEQTISREDVTLDKAIEQIDIGGPAMIRSAAKNFQSVAIAISPFVYARLLSEMRRSNGCLSFLTRASLAISAFQHTSNYDSAVFGYLNRFFADEIWDELVTGNESRPAIVMDRWRRQLRLAFEKKSDLRYGENPHQSSALYQLDSNPGIANSAQLLGKEMSFNNYVDADAAWQLICDFEQTGCAIIKHTNPAGVALSATPEEAYRRALACDPVSAYGGIVAFNCPVDDAAARAVIEIFTEVVIAPEFSDPAVEVLKSKKNLRVIRAGKINSLAGLEYKQISGGMLVQTRDTHRLQRADLKIVSKRAPSENEINDLLFAWTVCKHTKSNAIVYAHDQQTVGVGAGQMSRVDSVKIAAMRAQLPVKGAVMASDAFFPFRDGLDEAAKNGIVAVIEPGGSVRDEEVIAAADEHGIAMVFTGVRHFKH